MEKPKNATIKEMLFIYFAVSKTLYWVTTIAELQVSDVGDVGQAVLGRFLSQDFLVIAGILLFFFLEHIIALKKSKYSVVVENILLYGIGYVILMGIILGYFWVMSRFFFTQILSWGETIAFSTVVYIMIMSVVNFKFYFKRKEKETFALNHPSTRSAEEKLAMLKALTEDGVLTQAEFERCQRRAG